MAIYSPSKTRLEFISKKRNYFIVSRGERGFFGTDTVNARQFWGERCNVELPEELFKPLLGGWAIAIEKDTVLSVLVLGYFRLENSTVLWLGDRKVAIRATHPVIPRNYLHYKAGDGWSEVTSEIESREPVSLVSIYRSDHGNCFDKNKLLIEKLVNEASAAHRKHFYEKCEVLELNEKNGEAYVRFGVGEPGMESMLVDRKFLNDRNVDISSHFWVGKSIIQADLENLPVLPSIVYKHSPEFTLVTIGEKSLNVGNQTPVFEECWLCVTNCGGMYYLAFHGEGEQRVFLGKFGRKNHVWHVRDHVEARLAQVNKERAELYYEKYDLTGRNYVTKKYTIRRAHDRTFFSVDFDLLNRGQLCLSIRKGFFQEDPSEETLHYHSEEELPQEEEFEEPPRCCSKENLSQEEEPVKPFITWEFTSDFGATNLLIGERTFELLEDPAFCDVRLELHQVPSGNDFVFFYGKRNIHRAKCTRPYAEIVPFENHLEALLTKLNDSRKAKFYTKCRVIVQNNETCVVERAFDKKSFVMIAEDLPSGWSSKKPLYINNRVFELSYRATVAFEILENLAKPRPSVTPPKQTHSDLITLQSANQRIKQLEEEVAALREEINNSQAASSYSSSCVEEPFRCTIDELEFFYYQQKRILLACGETLCVSKKITQPPRVFYRNNDLVINIGGSVAVDCRLANHIKSMAIPGRIGKWLLELYFDGVFN